jgi:glutamine amidotransferase
VIAIVHTGGANLASVQNAIGRLGLTSELTSEPERIMAASHVILPGVGAAGDAMQRLSQAGLPPLLRGLRQPVLGICLGMQILFEHSQEGDVACLGVLPGTVTALEPDVEHGITVPHMGWNSLKLDGPKSRLFGDAEGAYVYFVHSYQAPFGAFVRAVTDHGGPVVAAVEHENFFGVQFHPERSGEAGAALLERFLRL